MRGPNCLWPGCRRLARRYLHCYSHWPALGEALQAEVIAAQGTPNWQIVLDKCQAHGRATRQWVKDSVTTGAPK